MQTTQRQEPSTPSTGHPSYNQQDWQKGYRSLIEEYDYAIDEVDGQIPPELQGTLFRNGPGLLDVAGQPYHHPFDGDGMISAIAFQHGRAHFRSRFVRTEGFVAEQQAKKILYRGVFGTQKPGGPLANAFDLRRKNIANTNVIYWGGKLLALWEAAAPYRLDPSTLETMGLDDLNGGLQPGDAFAAHPWIDPASEQDGGAPCLVNFSITPGLSTKITVYELSIEGKIQRRYSRAVPGFAFIHDFAITPHYCIFFQNPVTFNPFPFLLGQKGAAECITFRPDQPTQAVIIDRRGGHAMQVIPVESGFVFHHANAFEDGDQLVVDSISYASLPSLAADQDFREVDFDALSPGQLWRFRLNRTTGTAQTELLESRCVEFPSVHPDRVGQPYRYAYMGAAHAAQGNAPLQAVLKVDLATGTRHLWSAAPYGYGSEPVFVPRPNATAEDDGWLLTLIFNAQRDRSELVILDAQNLEQGAIATLRLKHHIPYGLHGSFTPECFETF